MKPFFISFISFYLSVQFAFSQFEASNWYFGTNAGITFDKYNGPAAVLNGQLNQPEGNATISDSLGNLLFYTDGQAVWNRNHELMQNGDGILGQNISAQSSIIVKQPNNASIYYLFTISDWQNTSGSFRYSIVDMNLDNGLGGVDSLSKNILLSNRPREQISAVYHKNCIDVWILTHDKNSSIFRAYLLTSKGLDTNAILSNVGMSYVGENRYGTLKFSPDGSKLSSVLGGSNTLETVEIYNFDVSTGIVSNPLTIQSSNTNSNAYSSEFSPNGNILYVTAFNDSFIHQFDLSSGAASIISSTRRNIAIGTKIKAGLQLGPDQKIYVSQYGQQQLGRINTPNLLGLDCNYEDNAVDLLGGTARLCLPNFVQGFFRFPLKLLRDTTICKSESTLLNASLSNATYLWQDQSTLPYFIATAPDTYTVQIFIGGCPFFDTAIVNHYPLLFFSLGNDTILCPKDSIHLKVDTISGYYVWSDGSTNNSFNINEEGLYWVEITTDDNCKVRDSIEIKYIEAPKSFLGRDTMLCEGDTILLNAFGIKDPYTWQDSSNSPSLIVRKTGTYWVNGKFNDCDASDTIIITKFQEQNFNLGPDTSICKGSNLILRIDSFNGELLWQGEYQVLEFYVDEQGLYYVKGMDKCITYWDSIMVTNKDCDCNVFFPNAFTPNGDDLNNDIAPIINCDFQNYQLFIYNRWGELIFSSSHYGETWDGTTRGTPVQSGAYFYILSFDTIGNEPPKYTTGSINVLR